MTKPTKTGLEIAESIVAGSGNNFHCKVLRRLNQLGWYTLISPYYMDNSTDKPREIDLIAEKVFEVFDFSRCIGTINVKLFIECKFVGNETVFWFHEAQDNEVDNYLEESMGLKKRNSYTNRHHYKSCGNEVAKLFASGGQRGGTEQDTMYKALNQILNAHIYDGWSQTIIPRQDYHRKNILLTVTYPVIMCNSFERFYRAEVSSESPLQAINDNFLLEVNYAYKHRETERGVNKYFLVDVVDFGKLEEFLQAIESDITDSIRPLVADQYD